jgi:predicted anti-sigma-YlaC factor YlaD
MRNCSFDMLVRLLDKQLDLEGKLEVFDHLDRCENCRDTVYQIARDRDRGFFVPRACKSRKPAVA